MSVPDYYLTLEIDSGASDEEIKQAFRRLAKKFHPDKNPGREKTAEQKFRRVMAAYEVLINRQSRNMYDQVLEANRARKRNSQRDRPRKKARSGIAHLCQLILSELVDQNPRRALEMYESLLSESPHFSLELHMSDADVRDCEFLLAEAYHQRGKLSKAARLYEKVLEREREGAFPWFCSRDQTYVEGCISPENHPGQMFGRDTDESGESSGYGVPQARGGMGLQESC